MKKMTAKRMGDAWALRIKKVRQQIQAVYDQECQRALDAHNRKEPEHKWKKMKTGVRRILNIPSPDRDNGGFVKIQITLSRIQKCGLRSEGATFVFLGSMLLPRCHFLTGQIASYLLCFLKRKDKAISLWQWCNRHNDSDLTYSMLRRAFDRLCASLNINFGERPSKLYRLAKKNPCLEFIFSRE